MNPLIACTLVGFITGVGIGCLLRDMQASAKHHRQLMKSLELPPEQKRYFVSCDDGDPHYLELK